MKRNRVFTALTLAVIAALTSGTLATGTLAKYAWQIDAQDSARAARFAFNLSDGTNSIDQSSQSQSLDLLATSVTDSGVYEDITDGVAGNSNAGTKLIAPGTTGNFDLSFTNVGEVNVSAALSFEEINEGVTTETGTSKIPIYYTYNGRHYSNVLTGDDQTVLITGNLDALAQALNTSLSNLPATGGQEGEIPASAEFTIDWTWAFVDAGPEQTDANDTLLGTAETAPTLQLKVGVLVTQIDS